MTTVDWAQLGKAVRFLRMPKIARVAGKRGVQNALLLDRVSRKVGRDGREAAAIGPWGHDEILGTQGAVRWC